MCLVTHDGGNKFGKTGNVNELIYAGSAGSTRLSVDKGVSIQMQIKPENEELSHSQTDRFKQLFFFAYIIVCASVCIKIYRFCYYHY